MFYVYRIYDLSGTLYIGKGSGARLANQKRRFGAMGEIIAEFKSEAVAYRTEAKLIAKHKPPLNRCSGGAGGRYGATREAPHMATPEGLHYIAPSIAKLIRFAEDTGMYRVIARIVAPWVDTHGIYVVAAAVRPFIKHKTIQIPGI